MEPRILYEDEAVIVIDKPAGIIVHSDGRTIEQSVAEWVLGRGGHDVASGHRPGSLDPS